MTQLDRATTRVTRATTRADHGRDRPVSNQPLPSQYAPRGTLTPDPISRARSAGVTAIWNGTYSGTVELSRLAGPRDGYVGATDPLNIRPAGPPPWRLSHPQVRAAVYEHCLTRGTQFEIYRWVNLHDLAAIWADLSLPAGVRSEWARVLAAAGLLPTN